MTVTGDRDFILAEGEEFKRKERKRGAFGRAFALPEAVNTAEISAVFKNGVLTVSMPKSEALKDKQSIPIN